METSRKENNTNLTKTQTATSFKNTGKENEGNEEPMDLTFSNKPNEVGVSCNMANVIATSGFAKVKASTMTISKIMEMRQFMACNDVPKKRGRKRKINPENLQQTNVQIPLQSLNLNVPRGTFDNLEYLQNINSKEAEVLKAAKSLFSKRTQTLYHWMYPNTPKTQLKAAVAISWETLGVQEKEFYVSQVLGRFGFPQSSLMVNPQLGGIRSESRLPPIDLTVPHPAILESKNAIKHILKSEPKNENNWESTKKLNRKKGRVGRPPGSKNCRNQCKEDENALKQIQSDSNHDEFQDDPELSREFAQFKWTLHMNDKKK